MVVDSFKYLQCEGRQERAEQSLVVVLVGSEVGYIENTFPEKQKRHIIPPPLEVLVVTKHTSEATQSFLFIHAYIFFLRMRFILCKAFPKPLSLIASFRK